MLCIELAPESVHRGRQYSFGEVFPLTSRARDPPHFRSKGVLLGSQKPARGILYRRATAPYYCIRVWFSLTYDLSPRDKYASKTPN